MPADPDISHGSISTSTSTSPSTAVTTPDRNLDTTDDDIWASDEPQSSTAVGGNRPDELLSDLPTVRRRHMTDGYREGLAVGKARVMQQGFDDGYPIGTAIALRVGVLLGVLEGYLAALPATQESRSKASIQLIYAQAKEELSCPALLQHLNDESIADAASIPSVIDSIISKWEHIILGATNRSDAGSTV